MDTYELARRASSLLEDPVLLEAFRRLRERYTSTWETTKPGDVAAREEAFHGLRALNEVRGQLRALADAPKVQAYNKRGLREGKK